MNEQPGTNPPPEPGQSEPGQPAPAPGGQPTAATPPTETMPANPPPAPPPASQPAVQWGAPQPAAPPPVAPQPAVQWQVPPPAPVGVRPGQRTTLAAIAGVILVVLGVLGGLLGALIFGSASLFIDLIEGSIGEVPGLPEGMTVEQFIGGVIGMVGTIIIVYSAAYILGGIGVLRTAGWGRAIGITVAVISGLIWGSGLSGAMDRGFEFTLVMFLVHLYVFFVLAFRWREPAVA